VARARGPPQLRATDRAPSSSLGTHPFKAPRPASSVYQGRPLGFAKAAISGILENHERVQCDCRYCNAMLTASL